MPNKPQLILSAFAEVVLIAISYLLMVAIAVACVALPVWGVMASGGKFLLWTVFVAAAGMSIAFSILRSLAMPKEPGRYLGTRIELERHAAFESFIMGIAKDLNLPVPKEILLVVDAVAYGFEKGAKFGFGAERCFAIGLPLFAGLTIGELRAVIAHEFVRSVYSGETRQAMASNPARLSFARVLNNLADGPGSKSWLARHPFGAALRAPVVAGLKAYWKVFLRLSQAIARRQTFWADEASCRVAGGPATQRALQSMETIKTANKPFWAEVVSPALGAGFRPELAASFAQFMAAPNTIGYCRSALALRLQQAKARPFDHQPPLRSRLDRLAQYAAAAIPDNGAPATQLIDSWDDLECRLLQSAAPNLSVAGLRVLDWQTAGADVWIPAWRAVVGQNQRILGGQAVKALPSILENLTPLAAHIPDPKGMLLTREQRAERVIALLRTALALCLIDHGWKLHASPGATWLYRDDEKIVVWELIQQVKNGATSATAWNEWCVTAGVADIDFAGAALN